MSAWPRTASVWSTRTEPIYTSGVSAVRFVGLYNVCGLCIMSVDFDDILKIPFNIMLFAEAL